MAVQADSGLPIEDSAELDASRAASADIKSDNTGDGEQQPSQTQQTTTDPKVEADATQHKPQQSQAQESEYSKAAKEHERRERSWRALEAEKAAVRAERDRLEREKQQFLASRSSAEEIRDEHGYSADDYERAAQKWAAEGLDDLAAQARQASQALRERQTQASREQFVAQWREECDSLCEQRPELRDPTNDLARRVQSLIQSDQLYSLTPNGFARAVRDAELAVRAESASALGEEVERLKKENDELRARVTPLSGGHHQAPPPKKFEDLPLDDQSKEIARLADEADRQGIGLVAT